MVTSISLAYISAHSTTSSVMGGYETQAPVEQAAPIAEQLPEKIPMPTTPYEEPAPAQFPGGEGNKTSE